MPGPQRMQKKSWMLGRHLGKHKLSLDTWVGYLTKTPDEIMPETGLSAGGLPSMLATFRADFFLRSFTLEKEISLFSDGWSFRPVQTRHRSSKRGCSVS